MAGFSAGWEGGVAAWRLLSWTLSWAEDTPHVLACRVGPYWVLTYLADVSQRTDASGNKQPGEDGVWFL